MAAKAMRIAPGDSLILVLRDSSVVSGTFEDLDRVSPEEYRKRYERWREAVPQAASAPELGARVEPIAGRMRSAGGGLFRGFSIAGIEVSEREDSAPRTIPLSRLVALVVHHGRRLDRRELEALVKDERTPSVTTLVVRSQGDLRVIPFDDVAAVATPRRPGPRAPRLWSFEGRASEATSRFALQAGAAWSDDSPPRSFTARSFLLRASPPQGRFGPTLGLGVFADDDGDTGVQIELAGTVSVRLGERLYLEPRAGVALFSGGFLAWPLGIGIAARATRGFGVRLDYTYNRLIGENLNYQSISSVWLGPYWSR